MRHHQSVVRLSDVNAECDSKRQVAAQCSIGRKSLRIFLKEFAVVLLDFIGNVTFDN